MSQQLQEARETIATRDAEVAELKSRVAELETLQKKQARLVQMKSYFLLPKSEEAERMREELTGMLVEYSACKEVAAKLGNPASPGAPSAAVSATTSPSCAGTIRRLNQPFPSRIAAAAVRGSAAVRAQKAAGPSGS